MLRLPAASFALALFLVSGAQAGFGTADFVYALSAPDDPEFPNQWGLTAVNAPRAWAMTGGSRDVKVAVLDSGFALGHPDLANALCGPFASFVEAEPTIDDLSGHGTFVAGIVAAERGNGHSIAGVASVCLMGAKVLDATGRGTWNAVVQGLEFATENGADVIVLSLGSAKEPPAYVREAFDAAAARSLIVAAAGNAGCSRGLLSPPAQTSVFYPARYPEVLAVAGHDVSAEPWESTSCGPEVDLAAPGADVIGLWPHEGTAVLSGTSVAAPFVAGAAALAKSVNTDLGPEGLRCALTLGATPDPTHRDTTGNGRLDAARAVEIAAFPPLPCRIP